MARSAPQWGRRLSGRGICAVVQCGDDGAARGGLEEGQLVGAQGEADLFARTVPGTTFRQEVTRLRPEQGEVDVIFERDPEYFPTLEGFPMAQVPFGSDAHTLRHLAENRFIVMTGPGSIRVAHTSEEHLDLAEALAGAAQYLALARMLLARPAPSDYFT